MNPLYTLIARALLSCVAISGYGWIVATVISSNLNITPELERLLIFLLGALTTSVVTIVNFWFSSTQGSADKSVALSRASELRDG
jgi:uncharacterized membrane protein required for colicin V production